MTLIWKWILNLKQNPTTSSEQCFPTPASSNIKLPLPLTKMSRIPEPESDSDDEENDYRDVVNIQENQNLAANEAFDEEGEILNIFQDQTDNIDNFNEEENLPSRPHSQLSSKNDSPSRPSSDQELENQAVQLPPAIDQPAEQFYHEDQVPPPPPRPPSPIPPDRQNRQEPFNWRTSPYWHKPENDEPYEEVPNSRGGSTRRAVIAVASDITKSVHGIPQVGGSYKTPLYSAGTTFKRKKKKN